ncbi:MAG: ArsR family transcriptional regulator [Thaumarchaeota archaeon]|jgi:predicted transcriptional regulator|nr:ArsR family transcriptional regulator [Nitrososphaerota archaeon]MBT5842098.1 ArsR family transcriptional regulator [Nitrososphaerota archaeon]MBT6468353.1 ArsR family transcriptional regulator [Nitrososphaerota archaeon]
MPKKLKPLLIAKYDITHKIFNEFADLESRHILFSIIKKPKKVQDIAKKTKIPVSTVYKKMKKLTEFSLVSIKRDFAENDRIVELYQSNIDNVRIDISAFEPSISFNKNLNVKNE